MIPEIWNHSYHHRIQDLDLIRLVQRSLWGQLIEVFTYMNEFTTASATGLTQSEIYRRGNVENDWNSSVVRRWQSKAIISFPSFPMPEVPLSWCWPSSEMPVILCFKIVGIPIKANFISIN